jgi:hypothetical protein
MTRQYWASRGKVQMGPYASREDALAAFRAANPVKKPGRRTDITTGYGTFGPHFDVQWAPAQEPAFRLFLGRTHEL